MEVDDAFQPDHPDYPDSGDPHDEGWDNDSAMGDSVASSTFSLTSSVQEYEHRYGRRYHAFRAGRYYMPNDEKEQELMDLAHYISLVVHDEHLFLAPIQAPTSILDVGTGTGTWAFDMADLFPGALVIGTDLSPIQPSWVPPNLQFEVSDCEDDWSFSTQFDLIHMRNLSQSIVDWPRLLGQVHQSLKPEGWVDTPNFDIWVECNNGALPEDSALTQWRQLLADAMNQTGRIPRSARRVYQQLVDAGFTSVTEEIIKVRLTVLLLLVVHSLRDLKKLPLSPWVEDPKWKRIAQLMQYLMERELEGMSLALFTRVLKWPIEDLRELLARVRADMANVKYELYCNVHYVYAQKACETMNGYS